ncbi:MAG: DUF3857 domain-containing protein [Balneolaceae bacterium]|nr:DUF3857 domain-containing protein [Balneolaceae bacterium]
MTRLVLVVILMASVNVLDALAQVPEMKWKEINKANLKMKQFEADSNASAVVLFDKGHVWFDKEIELQMERHVRIKILDKKGFDQASISLSYRDDLDQDISKIQGYTYYLEGDKIKREELQGGGIFEDEISDVLKVKKFTMPHVQPGVIIEYKYKKEIGSAYLMPDWTFQREIPVIWSKYTAKIPNWFSYSQYLKGKHPYYSNNSETNWESKLFRIRVGSNAGRQRDRTIRESIKMRSYEWMMKDIPALEKQPYVSTIENYRAKLLLQLVSVRFPQQDPSYHLMTWNQLIDELLEHDKFGERLESSDQLMKYAKTVTDSIADTTKKIQTLYRAVANGINWNDSYGILAERSLEDVFESKHGSGVEINVLLVQLLREIGLNADPVILSTQDHGHVLKLFPLTQQFNHVICVVEHKGKHYLLDANNPDREFGLLAANDLNGEGLVIDKENARWITLENRSQTKKVISITAEIKNDGSIKGEVSESNTGYEAIDKRKIIKEDGAEEYAREHLLENLLEVKVDTIETSNLNSPELPLKTKSSFTGRGDVKMMDDYLYINPNFLLKYTDNPFKDVDRKYPVTFPYTFKENFIVNLKIPEGYIIDELPKSRILRLPGKAGEFRWITQKNGDRITIVNSIKLDKRYFEVKEYEYLQQFYTQLVKVHQSPLVFKKSVESGK